MYGENRLSIYSGNQLLYRAHFLLFLDDGESVAGLIKDEIEVRYNDKTFTVAKDHLLLDFKNSVKTYDIGCYLYSLYLRPQGYTGEFKIAQVASSESLTSDELAEQLEKIKSYKDDK